LCSVYVGKTSTPRSGARVQGRRDVGSTSAQKSQPSTDEPPLSPVVGPVPPDKTHDPLQRTSSWQSSASGASSKSGGGSSRTAPVPKPRFTVGSPAGGDEVDLAPSRRPGRDARRRPAPEAQVRKSGGRSQSSPGDRAKPPQQVPPPPPPPHHAKATTPSRNGVVPGRSGTPRTQQQVDRSLGSVDAPLSAFVDRTGLVFDVRSKAAYRRGRLLGKVRLNCAQFAEFYILFPSVLASVTLFMAALCNRGPLYFCPVVSFYLLLSSSIFFSSPNLSGHRLDAYHTSTHDVALVRI